MDKEIPKGIIRKKAYTSVWLRRNSEVSQLFRCHVCTSPIMRYQGSVATVIPGDGFEIMDFPITIICRGESVDWGKCPAIYVFEGFAL